MKNIIISTIDLSRNNRFVGFHRFLATTCQKSLKIAPLFLRFFDRVSLKNRRNRTKAYCGIGLIKYGIVMGAGLLSFTQVSFAAPVLTPATVSGVSRTSAILVAKVSNAGKNNVSVWFEWGETESLEKTPIGVRDIYGEGYFQGNLSDLKEGTTYYFRAVAMLGSEKVTSSTSTFTTDGGTKSSAETSTENTVTTTKNDTQTAVSVQSKNTASAPVEEKAATATDKDVVVAAINTKSVSVADTNIASVLGAGNGVLPGTLIGWLVLFIAILTMVILAHMIYTQNIERKKALEAKAKMVPVAVVA